MSTLQLSRIAKEAQRQINASVSKQELAELKIKLLGRKGVINQLVDKLRKLPASERTQFGKDLNQLKDQLVMAIERRRKALEEKKLRFLDQEWKDVTYPGKQPRIGHLHPQTLVLRDVIAAFKKLGYQVAMGPEMETDQYNFAKLNFPPEHPARDTQDTLYLNVGNTNLNPGEVILRTHTSAMQGRIMEKTQPPLRVIVPGKCYRRETVDASHGFEFWQVEGFVVDKGISLSNLFGTLETSLQLILGPQTKVRFACTFFPFVEPGVDTYIECTLCQGKGCSFCKRTGWSEIMPAGMIHPNVFKAVGYDPKSTQGFAFALGLSRIVNLRYGINDLRILSTPDLRILKQF